MTGVIAKLLLDTLIIVLLALTISYCWLLNRRIKVLQDSKSELALLLKYFDESTTRASESIIALQGASKKIGETIQSRIDKANYVIEDLTFLVEKGTKIADQMEASFAVSRARSRVMTEHPVAPDEVAPQESRMMAANDVPLPPIRKLDPSPLSSRERATASLSAVLEKVVGRTASTKPASRPIIEEEEKTPSRSRAEQELLEMLRAGMKG